jgi:drug/metabolite transporter (DMT)-like permease
MKNESSILTLLLVGVQILTLVGGQILWKRGIDLAGGFMSAGQSLFTSLLRLLLNPTFLIGSGLYVVSTLLWFYLLARFDLSFIYPFLGLTFVVSLFGAALFLNETISFQRWIAVGIVGVGLFLLTRT